MKRPVTQTGHLRRIGFLLFVTVLAAYQPAVSAVQTAAVAPPPPAAAPVPAPEPEPACAAFPAFTQQGVASWYGGNHHGRKTANGEKFDMNALTAAHRTLPLGTRIRVTNLSNGKSIELRINDRGPYVKRRIIDLSRYAAQELGISGIAKVKVEALAACRKDGDVVAGDPPGQSSARID